MRFWKAWFDIRQRFVLCFVLVTLLVAPETVSVAVSSAQAGAVAEAAGANVEEGTLEAAEAYARMVGSWSGGDYHSVFSILAIVLAVGGILSTGNARSNLMTLSLPAKRGRWLSAQATVAGLLLLILCAWEAFIVIATGWGAGLDVPEGQLLLAIALTSISGAIWVWPAILSTSFTRESVRAALIIVSVFVMMEAVLGATPTQAFNPSSIADLSGWREGVPWPGLLVGVVMGGGSAWWSLARFRRMEF